MTTALTPGVPRGKALVEEVLTALQQALSSGMNRAATRAQLRALKPDLDGLVKMSKVMEAAMQSQVKVYVQVKSQTLRSIGDHSDKKRDLKIRLAESKAELARATSNADGNRREVEKLYNQLREKEKEAAVVQQLQIRAMGEMMKRPSDGMRAYMSGTFEYCMSRLDELKSTVKKAEDQLRLSSDRQATLNAVVRDLDSQNIAVDCEIRTLEGTIEELEKKTKVCGQREVDFHQASMFYGELIIDIDNLQNSLSLPDTVAKLLEKKTLVHIIGDEAGRQENVTLKALLVHLGGEYDLYVQNGLAAITSLSLLSAKL
jgi:chromosome segregation ATPase